MAEGFLSSSQTSLTRLPGHPTNRSNRGMSTDGFGLSSTGFTGNKAKQGVITIDDLMNDLGV